MVAVGETLRVPDVPTPPMPWLIETVVALVAVHVKVEDWPVVIDAGDAVILTVGGTGPSAAIGQSRPLMPARVVGVHDDGGRGNTDVLVWYTWKLSVATPLYA